jgi:hypothetical protein
MPVTMKASPRSTPVVARPFQTSGALPSSLRATTVNRFNRSNPKARELSVVRRIECSSVIASVVKERLFRQTGLSPEGFHAPIFANEAQLRE